jgi:hypothetical protein
LIGNDARSRLSEASMSANVYVAPAADICERGVGIGKDSDMTATRPEGCSVFLVEDEVMIRMMVADMLEELGHSVAAEAGEISEAVKVITPVAELINARNRPFIFATGYGSSGLPEEYRDRPSLQKPFQLETLAQLIDSTLKSAPV